MKSINLLAAAKVNLFLEIKSRYPDGYHLINTVYQSIDLFDGLSIKLSDNSDGIVGKISERSVYNISFDKDNLIIKACNIFFKAMELKKYRIEIELDKRIPIAAGLGGGSADAATTLFGLNELYDRPFSQEKLLELAKELGSDVPFCLLGGCALGAMRGEQLTRLPCSSLVRTFVVILPPNDCKLLTKTVYDKYDELSLSELAIPQCSIEKFVSLLLSNKKQNIIEYSFNSLELAATTLSYWVEQAKNTIESFGYVGCVSGSGGTVFTIVDNENIALDLLHKLESKKYNAKIYNSISDSIVRV